MSNIKEAIKHLKNGEVIKIPTDTVYGLAVLPEYKDKIYQIKNRDLNKPLINFISDPSMIEFELNNQCIDLIANAWPGKVTIILENEESYRAPNHEDVLELIHQLGMPILTTSLNLSGENPVINKEDAIKIFPELFLLDSDSNNEPLGKPSSIVDFRKNKNGEIIR